MPWRVKRTDSSLQDVSGLRKRTGRSSITLSAAARRVRARSSHGIWEEVFFTSPIRATQGRLSSFTLGLVPNDAMGQNA